MSIGIVPTGWRFAPGRAATPARRPADRAADKRAGAFPLGFRQKFLFIYPALRGGVESGPEEPIEAAPQRFFFVNRWQHRVGNDSTSIN